LNALKNSERNSTLCLSVIWKNFDATRSHLLFPLPRIVPFPALPSCPGAGLASLLTSNQRLMLRSPRDRLGFPRRLGREPANCARYDEGVRYAPVWNVEMVPICHPPTTFPRRSFLCLRKGSS